MRKRTIVRNAVLFGAMWPLAVHEGSRPGGMPGLLRPLTPSVQIRGVRHLGLFSSAGRLFDKGLDRMGLQRPLLRQARRQDREDHLSRPEARRQDREDPLSRPEDPLSRPEARRQDREDRLSRPEDRLSRPEDRLWRPEDRLWRREDPLSRPEDRLSDPED